MLQFFKKWDLFLKWWLFFTLICVGAVLAGTNGIFMLVWAADFTKLSFLIGAVTAYFILRSGKLAYKLGKKNSITAEEGYEACADNESTWFTSDVMLTIGMLGTVIGFIIMLGATFAGGGAITIPALQAALMKMSGGASAALFTTASGLLCGLLIRIQAFITSQYIDKFTRSCDCRLSY